MKYYDEALENVEKFLADVMADYEPEYLEEHPSVVKQEVFILAYDGACDAGATDGEARLVAETIA